MNAITGIRAFRNALGTRHLVHGYAIPSMSEVRAAEEKHAREIEEATAEVASLGFPAQGIVSHKVVWSEHDQFRHGTLSADSQQRALLALARECAYGVAQ